MPRSRLTVSPPFLPPMSPPLRPASRTVIPPLSTTLTFAPRAPTERRVLMRDLTARRTGALRVLLFDEVRPLRLAELTFLTIWSPCTFRRRGCPAADVHQLGSWAPPERAATGPRH